MVFLIASMTYGQNPLRGDICQDIPDLTSQQKTSISQLSSQHQKTMDELRKQFWAEPDAVKARAIKANMNTEQLNHYQGVSDLLTPEQKIWFDQNCYRYYGQGYGRRQGYGRGQGYGQGRGFGRGQGYVQGQGYGRGMGYGRGSGYGRGRGSL